MMKFKINRHHIRIMMSLFLLLAIFLFSTYSAVFVYGNDITQENILSIENHVPSINDDFADNRVIVTLKSEYSEVNKEINLEEFETENIITTETLNKYKDKNFNVSDKILIESIEDLTYLNNPSKISEKEKYVQILSIKIREGSKEKVLKLIEELEKLDQVLVAEPDYNYNIKDLSDDTYYYRQWGLKGANGINIENAWGLIGDGAVSPRIKVGIFEKGIQRDHPDLRIIDGNFTPSSVNTDHGTHVAGIIGAISNNGKGVAGISQVEIALLDSSYSNFVSSLTWAIDNDIRIVNASFGYVYSDYSYAPPSTSHANAIENFGLNGGILICAAGNDANDNDISTLYPAGYGDRRKYPNINNVIAVGAIDENGARRSSSNYGVNSVQIFAPGGQIYSTISGSSYDYKSGTSMAAPHVTGVAALLLSIDSSLTVPQLRTAILESGVPITISTPSGNQNAIRLNAYEAVKYVLENYVNTAYTLSNYSSSVNTNKTIIGGHDYFNTKNGFYKLNVTYAKYYEFEVSSTKKLDVKLYDSSFNQININDLNISNLNTHIIHYLSVGTYYLRVSYENENDSGTINTKITSRNTQYPLYNQENDILINYYNNINTYYYINNRGAGFYKFTITAKKADGTVVTYPSDAIIIKDHMDIYQEYKYDVLGYSKLAGNDSGINSFYMYLPRNGYFYIHINMPNANYSSMKLIITPADSENIDMISRMTSTFDEELFNEADKGDYAKAITINQIGKFRIDFSTVDDINGDITLIILKKEYNSVTGNYYKVDIYASYMNNSNKTRTITRTLEPGTYYIGYFNNTSGANITATLTRLLQDKPNKAIAMVADPGVGYNNGSEVRFNNGQYNEYSITEGFTRNLFFIQDGMIPSISRLDYEWYSSNPSIAIVSQYGTVFAKNVSTNTSVTIYAVYKNDPTIVYYRTFNILKDTSEEIIEIECSMSYSYLEENGTYIIELNETNCPYPWIQYYTWSVFVPCQENDILVSIGQWGEITATGPGYAILTGHYQINPRVYVKINLSITQ